MFFDTKITQALQACVEPEKTRQFGRRTTTWPAHPQWFNALTQRCNNCYNYAVDIPLPPLERYVAYIGRLYEI